MIGVSSELIEHHLLQHIADSPECADLKMSDTMVAIDLEQNLGVQICKCGTELFLLYPPDPEMPILETLTEMGWEAFKQGDPE